MIMIMIMSWTMTLIFMLISHPLSMGLTLLTQTVLISLMTGMLSANFWFAYMLFIIMVGGLLVLFIYMTSITSNKKFMYMNKLMMLMLMMFMFMISSLLMDSFMNYQFSINSDMFMMYKETTFKLSLNKYLNQPLFMMLLTMILYLFMTLIAVVKITNKEMGPLRQKF